MYVVFLFAVTRERVTDSARRRCAAEVGEFLFAVTRERVTDLRPSTRRNLESFYSLLRESGSLTRGQADAFGPGVSIRCYARAGH